MLYVLILSLILAGCSPATEVDTGPAPSHTPPIQTEIPQPGGGTGIEIPARGERLTLPLHILARVEQSGQEINAALQWEDGTQLEATFASLPHPQGGGVLIGSMDWMMEGPPPNPPTQEATLTLFSPAGETLGQRRVTVVSRDDPDTVLVDLYWLLGMQLQAAQRRLPETSDLPAVALRELLWGPSPNNLAGFESAIPLPQEVLSYPGRQPDWGVRVVLLGVGFQDGLAIANFSREMRAYGGGSSRVLAIRDQITQTLMQFEGIDRVEIAVEGQIQGALEP